MKKKKKVISVSMDEEVYERLHQYAFEQHQTMSAVIIRWIMAARIRGEVSWRQQQLFSTDDD